MKVTTADLWGTEVISYEGETYQRVTGDTIVEKGDLLVDIHDITPVPFYAKSTIGHPACGCDFYAHVYRRRDVTGQREVAPTATGDGRCACGGRMVPYDGEMLCMRCPA